MKHLFLFNKKQELETIFLPHIMIISLGYTIEHQRNEKIKYLWHINVLTFQYCIMIPWISIGILCTVARILSKDRKSRIEGIITLLLVYPYLLILGLWLGAGQDTPSRWLVMSIIAVTGSLIFGRLIVTLQRKENA